MNLCVFASRGVAAALLGMVVFATPAGAQNRGELLYATHCLACHTAQLHWRAGRVVTDWTSLKAEVRKWQGEARLGWSESDVLDVTRYLNDSVYRFGTPRAMGVGAVPVEAH